MRKNARATGTRYITAWVDRGVTTRSRRPRRVRNGREIAVQGFARLDRDRPRRTGVPEVILAEGKTVDHLVGMLHALRSRRLGALVSRPTRAQLAALERARAAGLPLRVLAGGRLVRLEGPLEVRYRSGRVALVAAGTSDVPVAEEARALLEELGIGTVTAYDVGVAGLHRLLRAVRRLEQSAPDLYLAFAGREGALPTVLAGLVRAPVVGVPTSVGYGRGGRGESALSAMLQSCAPLAVVNIDAAVPAALFAAHSFARAGGPVRRTRRLR
jgi:pyridinium-3,5-biscarboxylic acid mononucleotide synthase